MAFPFSAFYFELLLKFIYWAISISKNEKIAMANIYGYRFWHENLFLLCCGPAHGTRIKRNNERNKIGDEFGVYLLVYYSVNCLTGSNPKQ